MVELGQLMQSEWLISVLILVAAGALAFALPIGWLTRTVIVIVGLGASLVAWQTVRGLPQDWRDAPTVAETVSGVESNPNEGLSARSGSADSNDQVTVTYKVTATVRVNGELRSGFSLQQVTIDRNITFGLQSVSNASVRFFGEGVAVPIVDDAYLLVLMTGVAGYEGVLVSPCRDWRREGRTKPPSADEILSNAGNFSGRCAVAPYRLPFMLAVRDTEEPTGIVGVGPSDPATASSDLSAAFGVPVEFVSLEFSLANEPLQYKLQEHLRWIGNIDPEEYKIEIQGLNGRKSFIYSANILAKKEK